MRNNLFDLNYSDALKEEIGNIRDAKVRKVFMIYYNEMGKAIERNPEDIILTLGEFISAKILN